MSNNDESNRFIASLAIIALPFALGASLISWQSNSTQVNFDPQQNGFVAPRDIGEVIDQTQESTVSVTCDVGKEDESIGTGWAIDSDLLQIASNQTTVVTNHHVIDECLEGKGTIKIYLLYGEEWSAEVLAYDKKADLAILGTELKLPSLELSRNIPSPGYWVMALGSAAAYEGSVAFGNILNITNEDILITNNISTGNSGGPLMDNLGEVIGVVTWGMDYKTDQYNGASILDVACIKILKCEYEFDGEKTWFNYNE